MQKQTKKASVAKRRFSVSLNPEWERDMDKLKRKHFYDKSQSEMIRYLIELGLKAATDEPAADKPA